MKTPSCLLALALSALAQNANMVRDRGQTPVRPGEAAAKGGPPVQGSAARGRVTLSGTLVDSGCRNRTAENLREAPESVRASMPIPSTAAESSAGITVSAQTLDSERGDVMAHQTADLRARQADPTCAIGGDTKAFALLLDNGRLLDLDEGGNTFAIVSVQASDAGRAVLAGTGPGFKPRATIEGHLRGDKLVVDRIDALRTRP